MPADTTVYAAWIGAGATLLGSAAGAYFGAMLAFRFNRQAKEQEQIQQRVAAANRALFILGQQLNLMANIKKQSLDIYRKNPARFISMPPTRPIQRSEWRLRLDSLDFMLSTEFRASLLLMLIADDWFHQVLDTLANRFELHNLKAQPTLEAAHLPPGQEIPLQSIEMTLGPQLCTELRQATDQLYALVDEGLKKHATLGLRVAQEFEQLFPDHSFLRTDVNQNYVQNSN